MTTVQEEKKKQPSVLRTIRLSSALDESLSKDAEKKKIGKNALIVSILSKYVEWDSVVETFGYMSIPPEIIGLLLRSSKKDELASIAKAVSKRVASSLPLWFGAADLESLLQYFETSVKYSGAHLPQRIERQGKVIRIITYAPYDENGAAWMRAFNTGLVEGVLGYPPRTIEHTNSIETIIELKE
jgi:hypothetical protein